MKITKADIKKLLEEMEEFGMDEVEIDVDTEFNDTIYAIDFDMWEDGRFIKTLLTIEKGVDK